MLAGNKCECTPTQRMVDKDRGDKVCILYSTYVFICYLWFQGHLGKLYTKYETFGRLTNN